MKILLTGFLLKEVYGHSVVHASVTHYMPGPFLVTMDTAINKTNIVPAQGGFCLSVTYNIFNIYHPFLHQVIKLLALSGGGYGIVRNRLRLFVELSVYGEPAFQ